MPVQNPNKLFFFLVGGKKFLFSVLNLIIEFVNRLFNGKIDKTKSEIFIIFSQLKKLFFYTQTNFLPITSKNQREKKSFGFLKYFAIKNSAQSADVINQLKC